MENPIKMEDIGVPSLQETSIYKYVYIYNPITVSAPTFCAPTLPYLPKTQLQLELADLVKLVEGLGNCFSRLRDEKNALGKMIQHNLFMKFQKKLYFMM
jgi:hypothetical protein